MPRKVKRKKKKPAPDPTVEDILLAFAQPLFALYEDTELGREEIENLLYIAVTVWNAVTLDDHDPSHAFTEKVRAQFAQLPEPLRSAGLALFERRHGGGTARSSASIRGSSRTCPSSTARAAASRSTSSRATSSRPSHRPTAARRAP